MFLIRKRDETLQVYEFVRRFLLHVLPDGFPRIGHHGLLANRTRGVKLDLISNVPQPTDERPSGRSPDTLKY